MRKKKKIFFLLLFVLFFASGFFAHALFFPTLLSNNYILSIKRTINKEKAPVVDNQNKALTVVVYEDGEFDPKVVEIGKSYYLGIINNSEKEQMNLISNNPLFRTPRGYGKSEELLVQLYDVGQYIVSSSLRPNSYLKVIVK